MPQVICHGIPDDRELQNGDIVNVDVTAYLGGYHGDLNEVGARVCVAEEGSGGQITPESDHVYADSAPS
jgi:methionyl aminopeptidase